MENALLIALSRQTVMERHMETIANNIANSATPGFKGEQLMFVNFACDGPWSRLWQCRPVVVDDGGDCFFSLRCDPKTSKCSNLWINGNA